MTMFHWMRLVIAFCVAGSISSPARAQCEGRWLPGNGVPGVSSGPVYASVMWDPDGAGPKSPVLIVGGSFSFIGSELGFGLAVWDGETWSAFEGGVLGTVYSLLVHSNGDLVVGGYFSTAGSTPARSVARFDGTTWHAYGAGLEGLEIPDHGLVKCLAEMPNGDIVAGGNFTKSNGLAINSIARWNGTAWVNMFGGVTGQFLTHAISVNALAVHNGSLIAAGAFGIIGGTTTNNIARWNGTTWSSMNGVNGPVAALTIASNGDLIAGGSFSTAGGSVAATGAARWNGAQWKPVGAGPIWNVTCLLPLPNGNIVAAGAGSNGVMEWNGTSWNQLGLEFGSPQGNNYRVTALALTALGDVIAGGSFKTAGGQGASNVARWDGSTWNAIGTGLNDAVQCVFRRSNGEVIAGGKFNAVGATRASSIAKWTPSGWKAFNPKPGPDWSGQVLAVAEASNGDLIITGTLSISGGPGFGGQNVGRWTGTGWIPLAPADLYEWNSSSTNSVRAAVFLPNGNLVIGGSFLLRKIGGAYIRNLAQWNGTDWLPVSAVDLNNDVNALAVLPNGDLIVGGNFTRAGTGPFNRIARWDGTNWNTVGSGMASVTALAVMPDGDIVAGGDFTSAGGNPASCIARWNGTAWSRMGTYAMRPVSSLAVSESGQLIAGGGSGSGFVARWDGAEWQTPAFSAEFKVNSVAFGLHGEILAGGDFRRISPAPSVFVASAYFARWTDTNIPWIATSPSDAIVESGAGVSLIAEAASGYSDLSYRWQQEDAPGSSTFTDLEDGASAIAPATTFSGVHSPTLEIAGASFALSGYSFRLTVSNTCGESNSTPALLTVFCSTDLNNDGLTDAADFTIFVNAYDILDCADPTMPPNCPADINRDGAVDDTDFMLFVVAYNEMVCP